MITRVYLAHPQVEDSGSQQFLIQSGQALTKTHYKYLMQEVDRQGNFDREKEIEDLLATDRIIFQFPLYWYQAPAILKQWLDQVLDTDFKLDDLYQDLAGKELGLVINMGVKAQAFQPTGREGRVISDLLSPYETLARHFQMTYLEPFLIHQYDRLTDEEQYRLLAEYVCYLETGSFSSFRQFQHYMIDKVQNLTQEDLTLEITDQIFLDLMLEQMDQQAEEVDSLYEMNDWRR
ncbi:NAD(P)H-dependent oxidoreductase [Hutsoniella sourekii]|uniref:NAD(P)H-dependent oxidoreductase n=1 Tax=Hutsoniella sourekii TaxID=87650 RepID=UPI0004B850F2|nr:NAD(P)H-dependent oxidoreductase [Hutsoniella sourekii]